jgi:hypothetical protein
MYYLVEFRTSVLLEWGAGEVFESSDETILFHSSRNKVSLTSVVVSDFNNAITKAFIIQAVTPTSCLRWR